LPRPRRPVRTGVQQGGRCGMRQQHPLRLATITGGGFLAHCAAWRPAARSNRTVPSLPRGRGRLLLLHVEPPRRRLFDQVELATSLSLHELGRLPRAARLNALALGGDLVNLDCRAFSLRSLATFSAILLDAVDLGRFGTGRSSGFGLPCRLSNAAERRRWGDDGWRCIRRSGASARGATFLAVRPSGMESTTTRRQRSAPVTCQANSPIKDHRPILAWMSWHALRRSKVLPESNHHHRCLRILRCRRGIAKTGLSDARWPELNLTMLLVAAVFLVLRAFGT